MGAIWSSLIAIVEQVLVFLYGFAHNYGLAIILLTIIIRALMYPLMQKQMTSMMETQRIQPLMQDIQRKYKNDKEKMNQELMRLYKEHNVNPMGGCLPLLIQMPILILFFQILVLVRDQASNIRPELIQSVRSLGAGRKALFRFVYLPASIPGILTALRQSVGTAVAVLYVAELFATQKGLGYYIYLKGSNLFDYPTMYAGVVAMSVLGLGLYFVVDWLEKKLCKWQFES